MLALNVIAREDRPLTDQIVMGVKRQSLSATAARDSATLNPQFRGDPWREPFTVVEAYDRLVAMGCLQSRRGAGFYVAARSKSPFGRSGGAQAQ